MINDLCVMLTYETSWISVDINVVQVGFSRQPTMRTLPQENFNLVESIEISYRFKDVVVEISGGLKILW